MRQLLSKGQLAVCWALGLWGTFLLLVEYGDTRYWVPGYLLPAFIIAGLALLTLELRKRKPRREDKVATRGKLGSKIITFSLLIIVVAVIVIAIKTLVGAPPTKRDSPSFLEEKVNYIMNNPADFLYIWFDYGPDERLEKELPGDVDTQGKLIIYVRDSRGVFSGKSGEALLDQFKRELESIRSSSFEVWIELEGRQKQNVVAKFISKEGNPLGYFYQGKYHLWGE